MAKTSLVIVESPAKAKTIGKYLGENFRIKASMGHLRDLPKSTMGVDIDGGFVPNYQPIKGREELIEELRKAAKSSEKVYLATDPDREGEAISWHLKELLGLSDQKALRVTFNEITKNVVKESIDSPRPIDQNLVDAQQARRILDRIVGYKLSPLLWKKVRRGLSAGRVQSVATRMVVDREAEIRAFVPEEYWNLDATLGRIGREGSFVAHFYGDSKKKRVLKNESEVDAVIAAVQGSPFVVKSVKPAQRKRSPSPPFITSTFQQEASRRLGMTPKRAMSIAQQLYEGVDISGEGTVGLITYMRTDSLRISEEALQAAGEYIKNRYGSQYYYGSPHRYRTKGAAQDAHEAIRPSSVQVDPESIKKDLTGDQYRVYRLIWSRFVASQMANAVYDTMTIDTESAGYIFRANHSSLRFPGFTALYEESRDDEKEERQLSLPDLAVGETVRLDKMEKGQHFTEPPPRYTEATLVRAMEEKGIGRPSTYAPTISTILDREYVVKEGKALRPTPLGEVVTGLMIDKFNDIVDLEFTARMEENLDNVEEGRKQWKEVLSDFYGGFDGSMRRAEEDLSEERIKIPDEVTDEVCDLCGKNMVIKSGRFGRFLGCQGYPECKFTKPIVVEMPGRCPRCGSKILKRTSKKGYTYYACEKGAACGFMTWDIPVKEDCPECGQTMFKKSGRGYKKPFCINENCPNFLPEDKRGYKKKTDQAAKEPGGDGKDKPVSEKTAAGIKDAGKAVKKTAKKSPAKAKKPSGKKTAAKKTAVSAAKKSVKADE